MNLTKIALLLMLIINSALLWNSAYGYIEEGYGLHPWICIAVFVVHGILNLVSHIELDRES